MENITIDENNVAREAPIIPKNGIRTMFKQKLIHAPVTFMIAICFVFFAISRPGVKTYILERNPAITKKGIVEHAL